MDGGSWSRKFRHKINDYEGYVHTGDELQALVKDFEVATNSSFIVAKNKHFAKPIEGNEIYLVQD